MQAISIILLFVWSINRYIDLSILAISENSPWWTCFTYSFLHVSFLHLAMNLFVIWANSRAISKRDLKYIIPLSFILAPLCGYLAASNLPTCGFSSVVWVIIGYLVSGMKRKFMIKWLSIIAFTNVFTFFFAENINTMIHVYSFVLSFILSIAIRRYETN